jgi:hypothetical protein
VKNIYLLAASSWCSYLLLFYYYVSRCFLLCVVNITSIMSSIWTKEWPWSIRCWVYCWITVIIYVAFFFKLCYCLPVFRCMLRDTDLPANIPTLFSDFTFCIFRQLKQPYWMASFLSSFHFIFRPLKWKMIWGSVNHMIVISPVMNVVIHYCI